jgi:hypothetical protein
MSERKCAKYIVTEDIRREGPMPQGFLKRMQAQKDAGDYLDSFHMLSLNDKIAAGALYFDAVWMTGLHGTHGFQVEIQHSHDFDEILGFFGSNKDDYRDLDSEIEFWLEDEQYFLTKSSLIFVPKGMNHLPLYFRRIGSPVLFLTVGNGTTYTRATGHE